MLPLPQRGAITSGERMCFEYFGMPTEGGLKTRPNSLFSMLIEYGFSSRTAVSKFGNDDMLINHTVVLNQYE